MASRATSRLGGGMGGASHYEREAAGYGGYGPGGERRAGDPVDRILASLDRLGERIRTLSPAETRQPVRPAPRAAGPDDLQRAIARAHVAAVPMAPLLQRLAQANHGLLYLFMLLVPLSGFLGSVFSGYPIRFFGLKLPQLAERWDDAKAFMSIVHEFSVYTLMLLIAVHVLAFFHHQFILKDGLIRRMR